MHTLDRMIIFRLFLRSHRAIPAAPTLPPDLFWVHIRSERGAHLGLLEGFGAGGAGPPHGPAAPRTSWRIGSPQHICIMLMSAIHLWGSFGKGSFCRKCSAYLGRTPRGSCNRTLLRGVLRRFSTSRCFLEGFLEGAW